MTRFEIDIKPLFRADDREAMKYIFDLWAYDDVKEYADEIFSRLVDGTMPCDDSWDEARIEVFRRWIDQGAQP